MMLVKCLDSIERGGADGVLAQFAGQGPFGTGHFEVRYVIFNGGCDNQVTLFVDTCAPGYTCAPADRRASGEAAPWCASLPLSGIFPGVKRRCRSSSRRREARENARDDRPRKKLRGPMRITNAAGSIDIIPLTVRLKKP